MKDRLTTVYDVSNIVENILHTVRPIRIGADIKPSHHYVEFYLHESEYEEDGSTYLREKDTILLGNKYTNHKGVGEMLVLFVGLNKDEKCLGFMKKYSIENVVPKGTYLQVIPKFDNLNDLYK